MHDTAVVPTLKEVPDAGVQVIVTGDAPPVTVAGGYVTGCPLPGTPRVVMFAGHVIVGAGGFRPGSFGLLHADSGDRDGNERAMRDVLEVSIWHC